MKHLKTYKLFESEDPIKDLVVYHGTNEKFEKFDFDKTAEGVIWFTDSIESIKNGTHGGDGSKYILTRKITLNNPAGWDEYEKMSIGELIGAGYDGVVLPEEDKTDYIVFEPGSISESELMEMSVSNDIKSMIFYHGTSSEENGLAIIKAGQIEPGNKDIKRGNKLTPQIGKVYLASELKESVIYALGGNYIGGDYKEWHDKSMIGYLFVIPGGNLKDVVVDEDYVGQALYHLNKGEYYDEGFSAKLEENFDSYLKDKFIRFAQNNLTTRQWYKVRLYDDYADFAVAGKKLNKIGLPEDITTALIKAGSPIAHNGPVKFSEAWKFDKELNVKLKKDASNFFDITERIV